MISDLIETEWMKTNNGIELRRKGNNCKKNVIQPL